METALPIRALGPAIIGCGAGFSGDRVDAAGPVVRTLIERLGQEPGARAFLMFETLAERTLALAQLRKQQESMAGFEPLLEEILSPVLKDCLAHRICIVGNFGAANPLAAAQFVKELAVRLGARKPRVAVVAGDDVSGREARGALEEQLGDALRNINVVSANAYLGAESIAHAILEGADIVVCGRVADPSLALGPCIAHFGWAMDDWDRLAAGTMAGHLLECGAQVTGGYFADPGMKDVPGMEDIGFPIATVWRDGKVVISKARHTGGLVTLATAKEQLLYEVHDPSAYLTPDVIADVSRATLTQVGPDEVELANVRGHPRPKTLKVNVFYEGGWLAEGEISYAGPRAEARARLAADVLRKRLPNLRIRSDLIGALSVFADDEGTMQTLQTSPGALDVRMRIAAATDDKKEALRLTREVTALYTCGPAAGGGVRTSLTQRLNNLSCLVPRTTADWSVHFID